MSIHAPPLCDEAVTDADRPDIGADPRRGAVEAGEPDHMTTGDRHSKGGPNPDVTLSVVFSVPVYLANSTGKVDAVHRQPDPMRKAAYQVPLKADQRILCAGLGWLELVICSEQPDAGVTLQRPLPDRTRNAELGLEGPAIGPDVD